MRAIAVCAALSLVSASALAADVTVINDKAFFPEGPVMVDGKLLYVEYGANRATLWDGKSNTEFWHQDGCGPSAIVPFGDNYAVTCYDSGQMAVVSKAGQDASPATPRTMPASRWSAPTTARPTARAASISPPPARSSRRRSTAASSI